MDYDGFAFHGNHGDARGESAATLRKRYGIREEMAIELTFQIHSAEVGRNDGGWAPLTNGSCDAEYPQGLKPILGAPHGGAKAPPP